jgi:HD-GYP domain-containing protein (c-di-GMP phosphodiesterase class II)
MFHVLAGLSLSTDLGEGQRAGHAMRATLLAMRLASRLGLPMIERRDVYLAALVRDLGGTACAALVHAGTGGDDRRARRRFKRDDWTRPSGALRAGHDPAEAWLARTSLAFRTLRNLPTLLAEAARLRSERGAQLVERLGLGSGVALIVRTADEHWDGGGLPAGLRRGEIPIGARITTLADTVAALLSSEGPHRALEVARTRRRTWFDPALVSALDGLETELAGWYELSDSALATAVFDEEPGGACVLASPTRLDTIAAVYAEVIDAKSPWTLGHCASVGNLAGQVAMTLGYAPSEVAQVRRAALLHDLGKLSLPNDLLDKAGPLTAGQWERVRLYPWHTGRILARVPGFEGVAAATAAHHERLDGRGYPLGLRGAEVPALARIIAVADGFEALTSDRPYRPALPQETALRLLGRDCGIGVDAECHAALVAAIEGSGLDRAA